MSDQAETLRKMMQDRNTSSERSNFIVLCGASKAGVTTLAVNIAGALSRAGHAIGLTSGARPFQAAAKYKTVIVDAGGSNFSPDSEYASPLSHHILVVEPDQASFTEAYARLKQLRRESSVIAFKIIVNKVTNGAQGQKIFQIIEKAATKFTDCKLEYLGHFPFDEKIAEAMLKRKFLLDLYPGATSIRSLELLAKRVSQTMMDYEMETPPLNDEVSSRFMEEPVQLAPGNSAGIWKSLFGEVKA